MATNSHRLPCLLRPLGLPCLADVAGSHTERHLPPGPERQLVAAIMDRVGSQPPSEDTAAAAALALYHGACPVEVLAAPLPEPCRTIILALACPVALSPAAWADAVDLWLDPWSDGGTS